MLKSNKIYLDYASSTPIDLSVLKTIQKEMKENYANPGAIHDLGVKAKNKLEGNRAQIAKILGAHSDEIIFTSGATEANNLAILGVLALGFQIFSSCALPVRRTGGTLGDKKFESLKPTMPHIIATNIEHSSVLETCRYLEENKLAEVTYVEVEENGIVDPVKIKKTIRPNTILISVMYANNEIGTIQPIREIAKEVRYCRKARMVIFSNGLAGVGDPGNRGPEKNLPSGPLPIFLHTDATQAINYLPTNVEKLGVDLMSFNGAKIYGPKGVGVLFKKRNIELGKIMHGGGQELGIRPGTENLPLIAGLAKALEITEKMKDKEGKRLMELRNYFIKKLQSLRRFNLRINGDLENRLSNNINITIPKIPSDLLVIELSARGIYVSEKSACKSGDKAGSYVIKAIRERQGLPLSDNGSIRFSLGRNTTKKEIDYTLKSLFEILKKLEKWYH